jgi:hypothetical protein
MQLLHITSQHYSCLLLHYKQEMPSLENTYLKLRHYTQHNDTQHNDTQHNDTPHNDTQHNDTQHNGTQHNDTQHNDYVDSWLFGPQIRAV